MASACEFGAHADGKRTSSARTARYPGGLDDGSAESARMAVAAGIPPDSVGVASTFEINAMPA
jgi:hypothetical protein